MKITYLGQAGLLFDTGSLKIISDPYLSNSVENIEPWNIRKKPIDERFLDIQPDVLIFTHDHLDHYDPDTVRHYLGVGKKVTVLAPQNVCERAAVFGRDTLCVPMKRHTEWSQGGITFKSVLAVHTEPQAIGMILSDGEKNWYITGDTLYNKEIFADLPKKIEAVFLPVNGVGGNMNMLDAARFAKKTGAKKVVPYHVGLFDDLDAHAFPCENKVVPEFYQEIVL